MRIYKTQILICYRFNHVGEKLLKEVSFPCIYNNADLDKVWDTKKNNAWITNETLLSDFHILCVGVRLVAYLHPAIREIDWRISYFLLGNNSCSRSLSSATHAPTIWRKLPYCPNAEWRDLYTSPIPNINVKADKVSPPHQSSESTIWTTGVVSYEKHTKTHRTWTNSVTKC